MDFIHYRFFSRNYSNLKKKLLNAAAYDLHDIFFLMQRYTRIFKNSHYNFSQRFAGNYRLVSIKSSIVLIAVAPLLKERADYNNVNDVNAAHYASRYFQKPATEVMSNIIDFHNDLMVVLIFISIFITVILAICLYNYATMSMGDFYIDKSGVSRVNHNAYAEVIFTVVPAIIVYLIAAPSFALLYSSND
jgi:cytochrome c oxidase subunit 2